MRAPGILVAYVLGVLATTAMPQVAGAAGITVWDTDANVTVDSNVGRAQRSADVVADTVLSAGGGPHYEVPIGRTAMADLSLRLEGNGFARFRDLSNLALAGSARWRVQPTPGFTAPWFGLAADARGFVYDDSNIRNGGLVSVGVQAGKRFTDRIDARIGYRYERRFAVTGDVFDLTDHVFDAAFDYALGDRTTLYGSYALRSGGIVSTSVPTARANAAARAKAPDTALGTGFTSGADAPGYVSWYGMPGIHQRVAYRLDAITHVFELGINHALAPNASLDVSVRAFDSHGEGGNRYFGASVRAGLLYRFE